MEGRLIEVRLYIYLAKLSINICDATVRKNLHLMLKLN